MWYHKVEIKIRGVMKKFFIFLFALIFSAGVANAYIESNDFTNQEFVTNEGYSQEVYRLIHTTTRPSQARQEKQNYEKTHKAKTFFKKCYKYLDPYMDSGDFGRDDIKYYPTWDEI